MKIIIIGAGIAGLTLGLACERAGIECRIYEKSRSLQNIGGGILLWPHGVRYLEWLELGECLKPLKVEVNACNIIGNDGRMIFSETLCGLNALLGGSTLPVDRSALQRTLAAQLGKNILHLGKSCMDVRSDSKRARVLFADGSEDDADLVVGADGIHSNVRKSFNKEAAIEFTNHCWWGGIIEQKYAPGLPADRVFFAVGLGKVCIVWPTSGGKFMWYIPVKLPLSGFIKEGDGRAQIDSLCQDWISEVRQIISAPPCAQSFHLPIYALPPQAAFSHNRVVLIGDAAHALGPILGQGASMAIEDAYVLINCLQYAGKDIRGMLKHYESLRVCRYQRLYELETQSAAMMINEDQEALDIFQKQMQHINLADMYQDLIPMVDEKACRELAAHINTGSKAA